jgi:hypothetical protein
MSCPKPVIFPKNVLAPNTANQSRAMRQSQIIQQNKCQPIKVVETQGDTGPQGPQGDTGPPGEAGGFQPLVPNPEGTYRYATVTVNEFGQVANAVDNLNTITTLDTAVAQNTSAIATNTTNITANTLAIATNTTNIAANTSAIATNTTNITANTLAIATNTTNITANTTNIAANTAAITTNTTNIATNTTNIAGNTAAIAALATSTILYNWQFIGKQFPNENEDLYLNPVTLEAGVYSTSGYATLTDQSFTAFNIYLYNDDQILDPTTRVFDYQNSHSLDALTLPINFLFKMDVASEKISFRFETTGRGSNTILNVSIQMYKLSQTWPTPITS